jgi:uncharacterized protein (TIGR00730 family)
MRFCFIGSGVEREDTRLDGIEVRAVADAMAKRFNTLLFGGSKVGIMGEFATAFAATGGNVVGVFPDWLEAENLVFSGGELVRCRDLAERKRIMFEDVDAILCYPGGLGTWDELFDLLARKAVDRELQCPPIYLYNWENYYAPLLLQIDTAVELGLIRPANCAAIRPFASIEELSRLVDEQTRDAGL